MPVHTKGHTQTIETIEEVILENERRDFSVTFEMLANSWSVNNGIISVTVRDPFERLYTFFITEKERDQLVEYLQRLGE